MTMQTSRGLRNCNPLNIIKTKNTVWLGQINTGKEQTFCQFSRMEYGIRAALKLLRTYYTKYGCITLRQIISRWAPETENQVSAYIQTVCRLTGLKADTPLPPMAAASRIVWCAVVLAMASVECGLDQQGRDELETAVEDAWYLLIPST